MKHEECIRRIWGRIHGDPKLLDALTMGEVDNLGAAAIMLIGLKEVPVSLALRMNVQGDFLTMYPALTEYLRLPHVKAKLDEIAGIDD